MQQTDNDFSAAPSFADCAFSEPLTKAIADAGYEAPTPVQTAIMPHLLTGRDVIGQAQTGTGKTAAFALPLLERLDYGGRVPPQALVLAPTRELALQVAESFRLYGKYLPRLQVAAIFGGQEYAGQFRQLSQGAQVVVGTPGRIMDHIRHGSLDLSALRCLVLDEGDEMLRMGFIGDVEWILEQTPDGRQIALFSATMPADIRAIAQKYLRDPVEVTIPTKTVTAATINQRFLITSSLARKFEALTRLLETEVTEGVLVFVRTKLQTVELAERLQTLGYLAAPLSGDIAQNQRLRTVEQLKSGAINILIATDVAARGLDVERISHVINYDVPFDSEAYIHRIGRTGRAGRSGEAILLLNPRERQQLRMIERTTRQKVAEMELPTVAAVNARRKERFAERIKAALGAGCDAYAALLGELCAREGLDTLQVAAALAKIAQNGQELLLQESPSEAEDRQRSRGRLREHFRESSRERSGKGGRAALRQAAQPESGFERYRIEAGENHGVRPANIVGAIAGETPISSRYIGRISIFADYSHVDLPSDMPPHILRQLFKVRVNERMMKLSKLVEAGSRPESYPGSPRPRPDKARASRPRLSAGQAGGERQIAAGDFRGQRKNLAGRHQ
ncbi:MAG: DEAD/DEAH box helicase [Desulfobulbaceae bacterium]|jgi:ATP-dependent RNA helicase DeaD|nr:DEAD/DEAH box helicase [Desulfobulbaceae bacterium]